MNPGVNTPDRIAHGTKQAAIPKTNKRIYTTAQVPCTPHTSGLVCRPHQTLSYCAWYTPKSILICLVEIPSTKLWADKSGFELRVLSEHLLRNGLPPQKFVPFNALLYRELH